MLVLTSLATDLESFLSNFISKGGIFISGKQWIRERLLLHRITVPLSLLGHRHSRVNIKQGGVSGEGRGIPTLTCENLAI